MFGKKHEEPIMKKLDRFYLKFDDYEIDGETYDWFKFKYKDWKEAFRILRRYFIS